MGDFRLQLGFLIGKGVLAILSPWTLALGRVLGILGIMPENSPPSATLPRPRERLMGRDRFQEVAFWVLGAFLAGQICLMAWLDLQ
jgi:hypothetical protein